MTVKTFRYRLYPTAKQHVALAGMLAAHCEVYNAALQERREAYRTRGVSVKMGQQMAQLTAMREARPDQSVWSFTSQQQTLRRLDKAFAAFFKRVKKGGTPGYPRFRSVARFDSVDFRHGDGIKFTDTGATRRRGRQREARLRVRGIGHVRVLLHRDLPPDAVLKQVSIKREGLGHRTRWFVVLPVAVTDVALPTTGSTVGIDMGIASFYGDNHGNFIENPRFLAKTEERLAAAQRDLARKKRGSTRRRAAVQRVAKLHAKVRAQRLDHAHKTAAALVARHDFIAHEALPVKNMTRRAKPKADPDNDGQFLPNGAAAKTGLNKAITDAAWSQFLTILTNKAACAGRDIVAVNPANTSRTCSKCGHCDEVNRTTQAAFKCVSCGHTAHADTNAAINILRAGLAQRQVPAA